MSGDCKKIIDLLMKQDVPMTAATIAARLEISVRSVKKYVSQINAEYNEWIQSTIKGYILNKDKARKIVKDAGASCPQTGEDRINFVIKELLQKRSNNEPFNINDLAEELFVSYATIKRVLNHVRSICESYNLNLKVTGDFFALEGNEFDKRRLMSNLYYREFEKNDLSLSAIQKVFADYDIEWIKSVITGKCNKYHYYINGYALVNLILDLVISLDRISKDFSQRTETFEIGSIDIKSREKSLAVEIAEAFEEQYNITFNQQELQLLTVLLISQLLRIDYKNIDYNSLEQIVGKECINLVDHILNNTKEYYLLNTDDPEFYIRFTMHISNLLIRAKTQYINKNPLIDTIKNGCPLLFDCAVSMSNEIKRQTGYTVAEDEAAYIALHIGTLLEINENSMDKLKCVLVFPQYYDFSSKLEKNLMERYGNLLEIKNVLTNQDDLMNETNQDIVISTIPVNLYNYKNVVIISSLLKEKDYNLIDNYIESIKKKRKRDLLLQQLVAVTNPALFNRNVLFDDKETIIHYMMNEMVDIGYANNDYEKGLLEREKLSSTAFDFIAVPHSMEMNAFKTGMSVMLYDKPVLWGNKFVSIILLFTINKNELKLFRNVFDNLIVLLMEKNNLNKVIQSKTYQEFITNIIRCSA